MNKEELINFIEKRHNIKLNINKKRETKDTIYIEIPKRYKITILTDLNNNNIRFEEHLDNKYWVYVKEVK